MQAGLITLILNLSMMIIAFYIGKFFVSSFKKTKTFIYELGLQNGTIAIFVAQNIFNNKKLEDMVPSSHTTNVPIVKRTEYTLMDISDDGFLSLMDENGEMREDLELPEFPENYARELRDAFESKQLLVTVLKACGKEQIVSHKEDS